MPLGFLFRRRPVRVQPFFGYRNADRLILTVRALRSRQPVFEARSILRGFATMARQYLSREVPDLAIELEVTLSDGRVLHETALTDREGYAHFELTMPNDTPQPPRTRWERALVRWDGGLDCDRGSDEAPAYILAPGTETRLGIISDIDDTILETGITGSFRMIARNWKRVMTHMPSQRAIVPGAPPFYAAIGGNPKGSYEPTRLIGAPIPEAGVPEARVRPVFYVSSSPWNLFSYLVAFKRERGLPLGPVMLRDWGFNRRTLGKEGHGSHKREVLERILTTFPDLSFALIGDDTQKDLSAFGNITARFPGRISAVFIRMVSAEPLSEEELRAIDLIKKAGVPLWTGSDYRSASRFLAEAGLDFEGGVERLVRVASEGERPGNRVEGSHPA